MPLVLFIPMELWWVFVALLVSHRSRALSAAVLAFVGLLAYVEWVA